MMINMDLLRQAAERTDTPSALVPRSFLREVVRALDSVGYGVPEQLMADAPGGSAGA